MLSYFCSVLYRAEKITKISFGKKNNISNICCSDTKETDGWKWVEKENKKLDGNKQPKKTNKQDSILYYFILIKPNGPYDDNASKYFFHKSIYS